MKLTRDHPAATWQSQDLNTGGWLLSMCDTHVCAHARVPRQPAHTPRSGLGSVESHRPPWGWLLTLSCDVIS